MSPRTRIPESDRGLETQARILDSAERLFVEKGVAGTSMRAVTAAAGVNLAAVNYHFGSKQGLVTSLVKRRVAPVNQERLKQLDRLESGPEAPSIEALLEAFLQPVFVGELIVGRHVSALIFSEPLETRAQLVGEVFGEISKRFMEAFQRALPELGPVDVLERFKFTIGVMVHIISGHDEMPGELPVTGRSPEARLRSIVHFLSAGFRAPAIPAENDS